MPRGFVDPVAGKGANRRFYDYGVVILPRDFLNFTNFLRLKPFSKKKLKKISYNRKITIAGYPGDRPTGTLWRHSEKLFGITKKRLLYSVDTCPGHNGSPIWIQGKNPQTQFLIGIHTSGIVDKYGRSYGCKKGTILAPPGMMNSGVRLTQSVFRNIVEPDNMRKGNEQMLPLG